MKTFAFVAPWIIVVAFLVALFLSRGEHGYERRKTLNPVKCGTAPELLSQNFSTTGPEGARIAALYMAGSNERICVSVQ